MREHQVAVNYWWCTEHVTMHQGSLDDFNMEHRCHLHPVFVHFNTDRMKARD